MVEEVEVFHGKSRDRYFQLGHGMIVRMNGRNRDEVPGLVKLGLGFGVGFGLYMLIARIGGFGLGRGHGRASAGPAGPAAPTRSRDEQAVEIRVKPSPIDPKKAVIEMEGKIVTAGELIARIDAGGRRDVLVSVRGDTIQGAWDEIHDALVFAGIRIALRQPVISPPPAIASR